MITLKCCRIFQTLLQYMISESYVVNVVNIALTSKISRIRCAVINLCRELERDAWVVYGDIMFVRSSVKNS